MYCSFVYSYSTKLFKMSSMNLQESQIRHRTWRCDVMIRKERLRLNGSPDVKTTLLYSTLLSNSIWPWLRFGFPSSNSLVSLLYLVRAIQKKEYGGGMTYIFFSRTSPPPSFYNYDWDPYIHFKFSCHPPPCTLLTQQSQLPERIIAKYPSLHIFTHSCPHWWFFGQNLIWHNMGSETRRSKNGTLSTSKYIFGSFYWIWVLYC